MKRLPLTPGQIAELISNVALFIEEQRQAHAPGSRALSDAERKQLAVHFSVDVLDTLEISGTNAIPALAKSLADPDRFTP